MKKFEAGRYRVKIRRVRWLKNNKTGAEVISIECKVLQSTNFEVKTGSLRVLFTDVANKSCIRNFKAFIASAAGLEAGVSNAQIRERYDGTSLAQIAELVTGPANLFKGEEVELMCAGVRAGFIKHVWRPAYFL